MRLFSAIREIVDTANSAPRTDDSSDIELGRHCRYHWRVVLVGSCFAAIGVILGLTAAVVVACNAKSGKEIAGIFLVPVFYGVGGFVFGMALMCLVAPRAFLTGPIGEPWMQLIGTRSVLVARIVCLLFGLIVTVPLVGMGLLLAMAE